MHLTWCANRFHQYVLKTTNFSVLLQDVLSDFHDSILGVMEFSLCLCQSAMTLVRPCRVTTH